MTCYTNAKIKNGSQRNTSYGFIVYKEQAKEPPAYCLVRRWHTFAYSDFIQGKYQLEDRDRIYHMFELMTLREKESIQTAPSFNALWRHYWKGFTAAATATATATAATAETDTTAEPRFSRYNKKEYKIAMHKYDMLVKGYSVSLPLTLGVKVSIALQLATILANTTHLASPEWGFPKGKRNHKHETPIMCAQRELKEETNLDVSCCLDVPTQFVERFLGSNGVQYEHIYYLAKCCGNTDAPLVCGDPQEIGDIGWFSYDECLRLFREKDYAKKNVLTQVHNIITSGGGGGGGGTEKKEEKEEEKAL
jgi:8-oxo-dGTP pyrophosphatase MutT (NUDIX family)